MNADLRLFLFLAWCAGKDVTEFFENTLAIRLIEYLQNKDKAVINELRIKCTYLYMYLNSCGIQISICDIFLLSTSISIMQDGVSSLP